jgi:hypothetical protein
MVYKLTIKLILRMRIYRIPSRYHLRVGRLYTTVHSCKIKQEEECTYNVALRRVQETIVAVEKQQVLFVGLCVHRCACMWVPGRMGVCMRASACNLANPARNAYAPYCDVICGPSVSIKFFDII